MKNKEKTIRVAAPVVALSVLLAMCFAFFADGKRFPADIETVEAFYGRANFGGKFSQMNNVKRPKMSRFNSSDGFLIFNLGSNDNLDNIINPNEGLNLTASISSKESADLYQPVDNQLSIDSLINIGQINTGDIPIFDSGNGGGGGGGSNGVGYYTRPSIIDGSYLDYNGQDSAIDNAIDIGDNNKTVVVPAPAAALLAAIGAMAVSFIKKKKQLQV
jgi:hypothetical protein